MGNQQDTPPPGAAASEPILDFPLPQELKDIIWGHLLDAEAVEQNGCYVYGPADDSYGRSRNQDWPRPQPGCLTAIKRIRPSYAFETGILGVNKAIRDNAMKYLAQHNAFISVHNNCPALRAYLDQLHVCYLADDEVLFPSDPTFQIDIDWPCQGLRVQSSAFDFDTKPPEWNTLLVLEKDMLDFWQILRFLCRRVERSSFFLEDRPANTGTLSHNEVYHQAFNESVGFPAVKLHAHRSKYRKLTAAACDCFLDPIQNVVSFGYDIHFEGFEVDASRLLQLQQSIAPDFVCSTAYQWAQLDTLVHIKKRADVLAVAGYNETAEAMFGCLYAPCFKAAHSGRPIVSMPEDLMRRLADEISLSLAWLCLRRGAYAWAANWSNHLVLDTFPDHYRRTQLVVYVMSDEKSPDYLRRRLEDMKGLATRDEAISNDIVWLERSLSLPVVSKDMFRVEDTSVGKSPFPVFASHITPIPDNIVGWKDTKLLGSLSDSEKELIHRRLKQMGDI